MRRGAKMNVVINREGLDEPIVAPSGELAWSTPAVHQIMQQAMENGWIVLGGDVTTSKGQYTYDNWYYNPSPYLSAKDNVASSVTKCLNYVDSYNYRNEDSFYYVLVLKAAEDI
jgi:hypothetical protein